VRGIAPAVPRSDIARIIREIVMADDTSATNQPSGYVPPAVWQWQQGNGGQFASINRPISGATREQELPVGKHPLQLYSLATPNGQKVTIMLEELLAAGHKDAEYDAWIVEIGKGDQFGSGFVGVNPNSKIPALVDRSVDPAMPLFESGSILFYLAEKFGAFLPTEAGARARTMNWLMWQMGSAPFVGGGFGHFYAYAPFKIEYAIDRYAMETKRQLHVLDTHLAANEYLAGDIYTIADMAAWPWYGGLFTGIYNAGAFLSLDEYPNVARWEQLVGGREAVRRGRIVNRASGEPGTFLRERHDAADFAGLAL
jgi:GST-like protein